MSPSAFAGSPDLLAEPRAPVTRADADAFRAEHSYWIDDWIALRAARSTTRCGSTASGARCARYAAERGVRSSATCRSTSRTAAPTTVAHPRSSSTAPSRACRPTCSRTDGQLWGNPLYDWPAMRADGYRWWIERFRRSFELVDLTRVDHFRGFVSYWAVPARQQDRASRALAARPGRRPLPRRRGGARRRCRSSPRISA